MSDIAPIVGAQHVSAGTQPFQPSSTTAMSMTMTYLLPPGGGNVTA